MKTISDRNKIQIIRMRKVPFMDSTGAHNLKNLIKSAQKDKVQILLSGVNENVHAVLEKNGIVELLSTENVCSNINEALARAEEIVKIKSSKVDLK
jgi:sulfate permease, SulP family